MCVYVSVRMCVPEVHVPPYSQGQDVGEASSRTAAADQNHHSSDFRQLERLQHEIIAHSHSDGNFQRR